MNKALDYVKYLTKVRRKLRTEEDQIRIDIIVDGITDVTSLELNDVLVGRKDRLLYLNKVRPKIWDTDRSKVHRECYGGSLRNSLRGLRFLSQFVERWKGSSLTIDEQYLQGDESIKFNDDVIKQFNTVENRVHLDSIGSIMLGQSYFLLGKTEQELLMILNLREGNGLGTIETGFSSLCSSFDSLNSAKQIQKMNRLHGEPLQID